MHEPKYLSKICTVLLKNIDKSVSLKKYLTVIAIKNYSQITHHSDLETLFNSAESGPSGLSATEVVGPRALEPCLVCTSLNFYAPILIIKEHTYSAHSQYKFILEKDEILKRLTSHKRIIYLNFKIANWKEHDFIWIKQVLLGTVFLHWTWVMLSQLLKKDILPHTLSWENSI